MRTAVLRLVVDAEGVLDSEAYVAGLVELERAGVEAIASPFTSLPRRGREIEVVVAGADARSVDDYVDACATAFGTPCSPGVMTYVSRGTDDDVIGVLHGFGLSGDVERSEVQGEEVVTVTVRTPDARRVPESRLHTALEAAVNCEVQLEVVEALPATER